MHYTEVKIWEVRGTICLKVWLQAILEGGTVLWFSNSLFGWVEAECVNSLYLFPLKGTQSCLSVLLDRLSFRK